tara:strand:- start:2474 stop:5923 length:3450 start_codon:yes stop_codon:yes gene_type:complete
MANLYNQTEGVFGNQIFDPTTGLRKNIPNINESDVISIPQQPFSVRDSIPNVYISNNLKNNIQNTLSNVETSSKSLDAKFNLNASTTLPGETNLDEPMASGTPYLQKDSRELMWQRRDLIPKVFKTAIDLEHLIRKETDTGFTFETGLKESDPQQAVAISGILANALSGKDIEAYANNPSAIDAKKVWWCASYVHELLFKSHLPTVTRKTIKGRKGSGTAAPARANQYKYHGKEVEGGIKNARSGDIIVIDRNGDGVGQHAAIFVGDEISFGKSLPDKGYIYVLGGNQNNSASVKSERIDQILAVRRVTPDTIDSTLKLLKTDIDDSSPINLLNTTKDETSLQELQKQINSLLKQSGGEFTSTINNLVKQRTKLRQQQNNLNKGGTPMNVNNHRIELVSDLEDVPKFNKGGMLQEGGMQDDGMNRDPVSGNEVPPGSLAKEVRDDIPAQLSEGEYVVPADVVQYYGLKFFEDLRDKAKMALSRMERDGRIGGTPMSPQPEMDTGDFPFSADELQTFNEGGTPRGYQPGGGVSFVSTPQITTQQNPLTYVAPVMATPQMGQTSNFGTGVSGNVYTSGVTVPTGINVPSASAIKTARYINDKCSELTLLEGQGAPTGYVLTSSSQGIEYSKVCFPERYPDEMKEESVEEETPSEQTDNLEATSQTDDRPGYEDEEEKAFPNKSTEVFFQDKDGNNHVATVGGRDGYAGDQTGPANKWTYDDYSQYLTQLEGDSITGLSSGDIMGSIPIVSQFVKMRHKEVLKTAKESLAKGLNNQGQNLSVNERIVLENILLHKEIGGLSSFFNKAKDEEVGNINDLLELDTEIQTADGTTYVIKYDPSNPKADKHGYVRIVNGKQVDSSKLESILSKPRTVWNNGAEFSRYAQRDFLATGVGRVTDPSGNEHTVMLRGDYYQVGGFLVPIKDIMEEIGDPELALKLANNPSLLLGYLPPELRRSSKHGEDGSLIIDDGSGFGIRPGVEQGGFFRDDPFAGTGDYSPLGSSMKAPLSRPDFSTAGTSGVDTSTPSNEVASAGLGSASLQQTADILKNISQDDTPSYEGDAGATLVEQQKAREKQAQDNEDRRQAKQEAKVSQAYGGGQAAEKFTASQDDDDDDDDDAVSKGQQQGKGYTGGFGFRKGGMPKKTIQMERVKI